MNIGNKIRFCILIALVLIFIVGNYKKIWELIVDLLCNKNEFKIDEKKTVTFASIVKENVLILVEGIVLSVGLFAYVVVRVTDIINTVGIGGCDAVLVPFGAAMIIYALYSLVFNKKLKIYLLIGTIMCGIIFFNRRYISYQSDYYKQFGFVLVSIERT